MNRLLDQLQLRPHERRLLVLGAAVLFVVLNLWFVWPHYGDLARVKQRIKSSQTALANYRLELARTNQYRAELSDLEQQGTGLLDEDMDITLLSTIQSQARACGIQPASITPAPRAAMGGTNAFFEQRALSIVLNPTEPEPLLTFLVSLATNSVVLRVKDLDLKPDNTQTRLSGNLRVFASFQRSPAPPPPLSTPTNRPAPIPRT